MKYFIVLGFFIAITVKVTCQQVLVPYKSGDKYGLSDTNGNIIIHPEFDDIRWKKDYYFETSRKELVSDTLETSPNHFSIRKKDVILLNGLIFNGKEIIKNESYNSFDVHPGKYIIARCESKYYKMSKEQYERYKHHERFFSLFNIYGQNVYPDNFRSIQKSDTLSIVSKKNKVSQFILFGTENFDLKTSLLVFNIDKQTITDWLLKDIRKFHIIKTIDAEKVIHIDYEDNDFNHFTGTINYSTGKFIFKKQPVKRTEIRNAEMLTESPRYGDMGISDFGDITVEVPREETFANRSLPPFNPHFQCTKDSLFYMTDYNKKTYIAISNDLTVYYFDQFIKTQSNPLIYKKNNLFGFINKDTIKAPIYDSLFYLGDRYLAYKNDGFKTLCGILDINEKTVIPFIYDSIKTEVKQYEVSYEGYNKQKLSPQYKKDYSSYRKKDDRKTYFKNATDRLIVFKNGRCGMLGINNEMIIPLEYDEIASNGISSFPPSTSNYLIIKKNNYYGITNIEKKKDQKGFNISNTIEPVFSAIPCYYYPDYYNVKGYKLFALYNNQFNFSGYANVRGELFGKQ